MPLIEDKLTYFGMPRYSSVIDPGPGPVLFGAASSLGSPVATSRNGPYFIRRLSQAYAWQGEQPELVDLRARALRLEAMYDAGDFVPDSDFAAYSDELQAFITTLPAGAVPIAVGGDHSITLPLVSAVRRARNGPIKVVVFDHHLDLQYWGANLDAPYNTNVMSHVADVIGDGRLVHLGVAPVQTVGAAARSWFVPRLDSIGTQVCLLSPQLDCNAFVAEVVGCGQDVYLSIDVDVLPLGEMTSTSYPSDFGVPLPRVVELIRLVAANNNIVGCDLVEFAAAREDRTKTTLSDASRACALLLELLFATVTKTPQDVQRVGVTSCGGFCSRGASND